MADKEGADQSIELSIAKVFNVKLPPVLAQALFGPSPATLKERALSASATEKILAGQLLHPDEQLAHDVFMAPLRKKAARLLSTGQRAAEILAREPILLPGSVEAQPRSEPQAPSEAWSDRFTEGASLHCSPDVREMWARILAGEVAEPGSFSFRTLSVLRDVDSDTAQAFFRLMPFKLNAWVPDRTPLRDAYEAADLNYGHFLRFEELGLLHVAPPTAVRKKETMLLRGCGYVFVVDEPDGQLPVHMLTIAGRELARITDFSPKRAAIAAQGRWLKDWTRKVEVGIRVSATTLKVCDWKDDALVIDETTGKVSFADRVTTTSVPI